MNAETLLAWLLKITGAGLLLALIFVFCPFSWMQTCHGYLDLGDLTYSPLMSYLTRTLSAMYALVGALCLCMGFHVKNSLPVIHLLGLIAILGGIGVTVLDYVIKFPPMWTWAEGPMTVVLGVVLIVLVREIHKKG